MNEAPSPRIDPCFQTLLESDRVSARTRDAMAERARADAPDARPEHLSPKALEVLRAVVNRVLPQESVLGEARIDLALRIDRRFGTQGDGWRFAILPPDPQAYEQALTSLDLVARARFSRAYAALDSAAQDAILHAVDDGICEGGTLDAAQMKAWFGDLRADCVQLFISHPAVQGELGIDAVMNGGDAVFQGFSRMGAGVREDWEPLRKGDSA